jgi:hypothetical protein
MCAWCIDCLCAIFLLDFETVPAVWYLLSFILSLSWHVHYCTLYSSSYLPSDLHQNVVIINTNRNTRDLLFKSLFSAYCFVDHFRLLVSFFIWSLCCLSLLKNSFKTPKGVAKTRKWKDGHYNDKQWSRKHYTENLRFYGRLFAL